MKFVDNYTQLRLGGISQESMRKLYYPDFSNSMNRIIYTKSELLRNREQISDALHIAIGEIGQDKRKAVISFRRELYKLNISKAVSILDELDNNTRQTVNKHAPKIIDLAYAFAQGYKVISENFEKAMQWEREAISKFLNNQEFMTGLTISAPSLVPAIKRLSEHISTRSVDKEDRKAERSLHSYILRAGNKTSPFSTLSPISIVSRSNNNPVSPKRASRPSIYPIARVFNQLLSDPSKLGHLKVRISSSVREVDNEMIINRTTWEFKDNSSRTDFAKCTESTVHVKQSALTNTVASLIEPGSSTTLGKLAGQISEGADIELTTSYDILGDLIRLGFLEIPILSLHPYDAKQLNKIASNVRVFDEYLATLIEEYFERSKRLVNLKTSTERITDIRALHDTVARMYRAAGIVGQLPRSVVYEDVIVDVSLPSVYFDQEVSDETIQTLFTLLDFLDDSNVKHALMVGYFNSQNTSSMGVDEFIQGFIEELFGSFESYDLASVKDENLATDPWLRWGDAWTWVAARRQLTNDLKAHAVHEKVQAGMATINDIIPIDATETLRNACGLVQLFKPTFRHTNLLVQRGENAQWIVNDAFGGIGFPVSRFTHLLDEETTMYTQDVENHAQKYGILLAELSGGALFSNLNLHEPLFHRRLVLPGEPIRDTAQQTIVLDDLEVRFNENESRLAIYRGSEQIHPIYSGYLVPAATPQRNQLLSLFTPSGQMSRKLTEVVFDKPAPGHVVLFPRIYLDNLVIARARVILPAIDTPNQNPLTASGYIEWIEFWTDRGLPMSSFIRIHDESSSSNKPYFFDILQVLSCSNLYNNIRKAVGEAFVEITEVLPENPSVRHKGTAVVSEQMIGISWTEDA